MNVHKRDRVTEKTENYITKNVLILHVLPTASTVKVIHALH